jgi:hypothetical protein
VNSPLFCAIFSSDLLQTLNNEATIMKFRSDIYKTINFDVRKVGEIGKAEDLSAHLRIVHPEFGEKFEQRKS